MTAAAENFPHVPPEAVPHLDGFIRHFVAKEKQGRWRSVYSMKPKKWNGVSAYDCSEPELADWNTPPLDTLTKHNMAKYLDTPGFIFPVGHSADLPYRGTLRDALLGNDSVTECVVSLEPGKLAVCYGHSGELRICRH